MFFAVFNKLMDTSTENISFLFPDWIVIIILCMLSICCISSKFKIIIKDFKNVKNGDDLNVRRTKLDSM